MKTKTTQGTILRGGALIASLIFFISFTANLALNYAIELTVFNITMFATLGALTVGVPLGLAVSFFNYIERPKTN